MFNVSINQVYNGMVDKTIPPPSFCCNTFPNFSKQFFNSSCMQVLWSRSVIGRLRLHALVLAPAIT